MNDKSGSGVEQQSSRAAGVNPHNTKPKCPRCGRIKAVVRLGDYCLRCEPHYGGCGAMFDNDPDEGGTYSDRNPAARIEREERRRER